jgi:O-acetylserine/cysteine efflux transporter
MNEITTASTPSTRLAQNAPLLVIALLAVDGLHFVFARALHDYLPPVTSVLYVLGLGTLQVALFAIARRRFRWSTFRRHAPFFLAIGALVAIGTTTNYTAVAFVDPGTASLLAQTSILFGVGFGVLWLRDRLGRVQWLGALVAIAGVGLITFQPGNYLQLGSVMVIGSSFLYALHAAIVKRYGAGIEFLEFFVWRLASTTGFLFLSATAQGMLIWPSGPAWLIILLVATVDILISRTLYYLALRRLTISLLSLVLTVSPIVAILWSVALFKSQPTPRELLGGAAVLVGIAIVTGRRS